MSMNRRSFMAGCSAAIASMSTAQMSHLAFGSPEDEPNQEILVVIFLRGGLDGLSLVPVIDGPDREHYELARSDIAIPVAGENAALPLDDVFGLHPSAAPLHELYQDQKLAIVHAAGLNHNTRSHFDAMALMELGTASLQDDHTGWLTRHMLTTNGFINGIPNDVLIPAVAVGKLQPTSFAGSGMAVGMVSPDDFGFGGSQRYDALQREALRDVYTGNNWIHAACQQTLDAIDTMEIANPGEYSPANGVQYPAGSFGRNLQSVAQMIKLQIGLSTATVDYGGWDTHESQGNSGDGYFADRFDAVARGLNAFYTDLSNGPNGSNTQQRVTTVVMSEFGRSLKENGSNGTDHGHGNVMLVMGDNVNGGTVHGDWPGLHADQLYDRRDLAITTDYRQVLSELLLKQFSNPHLGDVFPGFTDYQPLGLLQGASVEPSFESSLNALPELYRQNDGNITPAVYLPLISNQ